MKEDWTQKEGWLQQDNLIYVGLIGIGVVIMQTFIAATSLDLPSSPGLRWDRDHFFRYPPLAEIS